MPIDPAQGFATDPTDALRARIIELERRLRDNPGAQAAYDSEPSTVATSAAGAYVDLGGPSIELLVPQGGAFVELYAELEGRDVNNTGAPAQAGIYEPTDFAAGVGNIDFSAAAFVLRRLLPPATGAAGTGGASGLGVFGIYWATGGLRTYSLRYRHALGNPAEFRNRRLWGRVSY